MINSTLLNSMSTTMMSSWTFVSWGIAEPSTGIVMIAVLLSDSALSASVSPTWKRKTRVIGQHRYAPFEKLWHGSPVSTISSPPLHIASSAEPLGAQQSLSIEESHFESSQPFRSAGRTYTLGTSKRPIKRPVWSPPASNKHPGCDGIVVCTRITTLEFLKPCSNEPKSWPAAPWRSREGVHVIC